MKAIVFDMDGILFDTERVSDLAWRQAAEEMQFVNIEAAIEGCRGLNRADTRAFFESHFPNVDYLASVSYTHLTLPTTPY